MPVDSQFFEKSALQTQHAMIAFKVGLPSAILRRGTKRCLFQFAKPR